MLLNMSQLVKSNVVFKAHRIVKTSKYRKVKTLQISKCKEHNNLT